MTQFALQPHLDADELGRMFAAAGRLQIVDFLEESCVVALYKEFVASGAWRLAVNSGEVIKDYRPEDIASWPAQKRAALDRAVVQGGRKGFQFRYETIRLPKPGQPPRVEPPPLLDAFIRFLCSDELLDFMRRLTGAADIALADAHASRYMPGHFLTAHDDASGEMGRRAAYVLNLCPQWRPDWGGLLLFYDRMGNVVRGYTPRFNSLNIFRVPQPHSVSWVTPLAGQPRYAITGWLRAAS